ncbi:MAG TPA: hypothetical protein VM580_35370 [Labilithrix sp.]|nr:hypothetical protein [Labilithrix sp.]
MPLAFVRRRRAGAFVVLDLWSDDEERGDEEEWFEGGRLATLTPLRAQLLQGDLRVPYVAWLSSVQSGDVNENDCEPPVPPGLSDPAAPIVSLAEFLRIDCDLMAAAAEASRAPEGNSKELRAWAKALPAAEKDRWLLRAVDNPDAALGAELHAAFRKGRSSGSSEVRRTVGALLARANELRERREATGAVKRARARAVAARARDQALHRLAKRKESAWAELESLVDARAYEKAWRWRSICEISRTRDGHLRGFDERFGLLKRARAPTRVVRRVQTKGARAMMPFDTVFPDIEKNEARVIRALDHDELPRDTYVVPQVVLQRAQLRLPPCARASVLGRGQSRGGDRQLRVRATEGPLSPTSRRSSSIP